MKARVLNAIPAVLLGCGLAVVGYLGVKICRLATEPYPAPRTQEQMEQAIMGDRGFFSAIVAPERAKTAQAEAILEIVRGELRDANAKLEAYQTICHGYQEILRSLLVAAPAAPVPDDLIPPQRLPTLEQSPQP